MRFAITCVDEILGNNHLFVPYEEECKGSLTPEILPDAAKYLELEKQDILYSIGAYDDDKMVGFAVFNVSVMLHYSDLAASMESIFLLKEYRVGNTGRDLIYECEYLAKDLGAKNFFITAPVQSALASIAPKYGYTHTNSFFTKKL